MRMLTIGRVRRLNLRHVQRNCRDPSCLETDGTKSMKNSGVRRQDVAATAIQSRIKDRGLSRMSPKVETGSVIGLSMAIVSYVWVTSTCSERMDAYY